MIFIGIDPGKSGAFAIIDDMDGEGQTAYRAFPWDKDLFFKYLVTSLNGEFFSNKPIVCVEKVGAMPGQGVTSTFNFGKSAGYIEGILDSFCISYQLVPPQKWKKEFSLGSDKKKSIEVCKRLFPNVSLRRTEKCTTDNPDMAEALLMAEYARRHF